MIKLTESAVLKVKEMLADTENPEKNHLRIGVDYGGCSGFSYSLGFDEAKQESDELYEQSGVKVLIDKDSQPHLAGTVIDYKESLMGGGFSIDNPNASLTCGCGSSFRTSKDAGKPGDC